MKNATWFSALHHLFSESTFSSFIYTLVFLCLFYSIKKYPDRLRKSDLLSNIFIVWSIITVMYLIVQTIQNLARYIELKRYDNGDTFKVELGDLGLIIIVPIVVAVIFNFYLWISRYWKHGNQVSKTILFEVIFIFVTTMSAMALSSWFLRDSDNLLYAMTVWIPGPTGCALAFAAYNYYRYHNKLKMQEKELQISRLKQELSQSQLDALSSKINPHFLYNALNSIAGLATTDGSKTRSMAIALSKLFRYNINREESNYVSVKNELEMVLTYLEIEKIRFGERLSYKCNVPEELNEVLIPRHLLQPLVENAVKHGGNLALLEISITLTMDEKGIVLRVADNGKPFDQHFSPGYGLKSLYDKLDLLTSGHYEIAFENNPKQVMIVIGNDIKLS